MADAYITPEEFKATGKPKTCAEQGWDQADVTKRFPETGATPQWTVDRAAWQRALIVSDKTGKRIIPGKNRYYFDGGVWYDGLWAEIMGLNTEFASTTTTPFSYLYRKARPTSRLEAEAMISNSELHVEGIVINGAGKKHTGFDFNSVRVSVKKCHLNDVNTGMKVDFCLWADIRNNYITGGNNGILSGLAIAGDNEMSSNLGRFINNRLHTVSNIGFSNEFAYETEWRQNTVEGNGTIKHGMLIDFTGKTTAKNFGFGMMHFEQTGGCADSIIRVLTRDQKIPIDNIIAHYPGILIHATSSGGGGVVLHRCHWSVGMGGKKLRSNNAMWRFIGVTDFTEGSASGIWAADMGGVVPNKGWANDVGYNSYLFGHEEWSKPPGTATAESSMPDIADPANIEEFYKQKGEPYIDMETGETVDPVTGIREAPYRPENRIQIKKWEPKPYDPSEDQHPD